MTGEVVRQTLATRGIVYEPYIYKTGLFDRAWSRFKAPIEIYWSQYVSGQASRDEAIKSVVAGIKMINRSPSTDCPLHASQTRLPG